MFYWMGWLWGWFLSMVEHGVEDICGQGAGVNLRRALGITEASFISKGTYVCDGVWW